MKRLWLKKYTPVLGGTIREKTVLHMRVNAGETKSTPILCDECPPCLECAGATLAFPHTSLVSSAVQYGIFPDNDDYQFGVECWDILLQEWTEGCLPKASSYCDCSEPDSNLALFFFPLPQADQDEFTNLWGYFCVESGGDAPTTHFMLRGDSLLYDTTNGPYIKSGVQYEVRDELDVLVGYRTYVFEYTSYTYSFFWITDPTTGGSFTGHAVNLTDGSAEIKEYVYDLEGNLLAQCTFTVGMSTDLGWSTCRNKPDKCEDLSCAYIWGDSDPHAETPFDPASLLTDWLCYLVMLDPETEEVIGEIDMEQLKLHTIYLDTNTITEEEISELSCEHCGPGQTIYLWSTGILDETEMKYVWYYYCFEDPDDIYLNATIREAASFYYTNVITDSGGNECGTFTAWTDSYGYAGESILVNSTYGGSLYPQNCEPHNAIVPDACSGNLYRYKCNSRCPECEAGFGSMVTPNDWTASTEEFGDFILMEGTEPDCSNTLAYNDTKCRRLIDYEFHLGSGNYLYTVFDDVESINDFSEITYTSPTYLFRLEAIEKLLDEDDNFKYYCKFWTSESYEVGESATIHHQFIKENKSTSERTVFDCDDFSYTVVSPAMSAIQCGNVYYKWDLTAYNGAGCTTQCDKYVNMCHSICYLPLELSGVCYKDRGPNSCGKTWEADGATKRYNVTGGPYSVGNCS